MEHVIFCLFVAEQLTLLVLENIHRVKLWNKAKTNQRGEVVDGKRLILQMFPVRRIKKNLPFSLSVQ